jgi:beta-galactosidase
MLHSWWPLVVAAAMGMAMAASAASAAYVPPASPRERRLVPGPWRCLASAEALPDAQGPAFDDSAWPLVEVPHVYNKKSEPPGGAATWSGAIPGIRNRAWYRTRLDLPKGAAGRRIYLFFEGAAVVADVYLNGRRLGQHRGAWTAFIFDATEAVRPGGGNVLAVRVESGAEETADCLPSGTGKQLYRVFGGLYRKVWLLLVDPVHVDPTDDAAPGVYLAPSDVSRESAALSVRALLRNASDNARTVSVENVVCGPDGREVLRLSGDLKVEAGERRELERSGRIVKPLLWGPGTPNLYTVHTIVSDGGAVRDAVTQRCGFRWYALSDTEFLLNGRPTPIRGINKHQETERRATAVADEDLVRDFDVLQDLGVNYVRLCHYPHADLEYRLADERGLMAMAENGHSNNARAWTEAGAAATREMVKQLYNHPSIVHWSVGNEASAGPAEKYAEVVRSADRSRPVAAVNMACKAADLHPTNTYPGWYGGKGVEKIWQFQGGRPVAETGAGGVVTCHSPFQAADVRADAWEPEEYQALVLEQRFQTAFRDQKDRLPLFLVWVLRDFTCMYKYKRINTKGLLTYAGEPKDGYFLYQCFLRPEEPVVHLAGKRHFLRRGDAARGVKAYSNRPALRLTVNGRDAGTERSGEYRHSNGRAVENVFYWPAVLQPGRNLIEVSDGAGRGDSAVVYCHGEEGPAGPPDPGALVVDLSSANPASPAYFLDAPLRAEWPFYWEFDGTADNALADLPEAVRGARWIATRRLSKPEAATELAFTINPKVRAAEVFIMATAAEGAPPFVREAGFADTGAQGLWRDNNLDLVPYGLYRRAAKGGERVTVPRAVHDYLVLVKGEAP